MTIWSRELKYVNVLCIYHITIWMVCTFATISVVSCLTGPLSVAVVYSSAPAEAQLQWSKEGNVQFQRSLSVAKTLNRLFLKIKSQSVCRAWTCPDDWRVKMNPKHEYITITRKIALTQLSCQRPCGDKLKAFYQKRDDITVLFVMELLKLAARVRFIN